jgi:ribonuclease HI
MAKEHIRINRRSKGYTPVVIYTDGSSDNKAKTGGWAFVAHFEGRIEAVYGFAENTSNNRMEVSAMIEALDFIRPTPHPLHIWTDSTYVIHWVKFARHADEGTLNFDLVTRLGKLAGRQHVHRELCIKWVKGHKGDLFNEIADKMASMAHRDRKSGRKTIRVDHTKHTVKSLLALLL